MGSSHVTCGISGQQIFRGDQVVLVLLKSRFQHFTSGTLLDAHEIFQPASFVLRGRYDDYSWISEPEDNLALKGTLKIYGHPDIKTFGEWFWRTQNRYTSAAKQRSALLYPFFAQADIYEETTRSNLKYYAELNERYFKALYKAIDEIEAFPLPPHLTTDEAEARDTRDEEPGTGKRKSYVAPEDVRKEKLRFLIECDLYGIYDRDVYPSAPAFEICQASVADYLDHEFYSPFVYRMCQEIYREGKHPRDTHQKELVELVTEIKALDSALEYPQARVWLPTVSRGQGYEPDYYRSEIKRLRKMLAYNRRKLKKYIEENGE